MAGNMKNVIFLTLVCCFFGSKSQAQDFSFAFFTDMHIYNDSTLDIVHQKLKESKPLVDFVLLGGDNIDIDNQSAESLPQAIARYHQLKDLFAQENISYFPSIGNHDRLPKSMSLQADSVFEAVFGETYYSFEHHGVKFIVLNSVQQVDHKYAIGDKQLQWLKDELQKTDKKQPIVISTHVPFISVYYPILTGKYTDADTFSNQHEVFNLFQHHNLKLVLQGHMHLYEEVYVKGVNFITAGAVSGNWWNGNYEGTEPGRLYVHYKNGDFHWEYK